MKPKDLKIVGIVAIIIVVLNIFLFAFTVISSAIFWSVIVVAAVFVYFVLPKLKEKSP
ncbi:TPA: hypothetical protein HA278_08335 [Candidatus Woesearchaeota archaeon]|jgi:hypothetical protein|nr:hypothetical protein [Candidatus Woesearchaeota archaeon]|tara:strand:+ start:337 stop:510 length:174 start_codon:yes stop_codon:yes gene_type:complete